jgi:hypothetical protein
MTVRRTIALASATLALVLSLTAQAVAAGTTVTVRVEGVKRTLLAPQQVHTHAGSITKDGTPKGSCPATTAAGALDVATKHRWVGTYESGLGINITSILGERHVYSAHGYYWGIWVDNEFAQFGICDLKLHRGEQILFAPAPGTGNVVPAGLTGPTRAMAGKAFTLKAVYYTAKGKPKPLAKARVKAGKLSAVTNKHGVATFKATQSGKLKFVASEKGYIRSAPLTVKVS